MADESTPSADSLSDLWNQVNTDFAAAGDAPPTADDTPESAPSGAAPQTETATPAKTDGTDSAKAAPTPKQAEPKKPEGESDTEARLKKLENDLALARKGQAAADRRANALEQARQLEAQRIHELTLTGQLTQEEVERGPQLMQGWVQRADAEAQQAEYAAEQQRLTAETDQARSEREAELEFSKQALPLVNEMLTLGLSTDDADYEQLLKDTVQSDKYAADVALTWKLEHDPPEAARVYERLMSSAMVDVKAELAKIAAAKRETETKKGAVNQYDRSSSPGPSTGGADPIPNMPLEEMWSRVDQQWKT
jgi:hypothetical protein